MKHFQTSKELTVQTMIVLLSLHRKLSSSSWLESVPIDLIKEWQSPYQSLPCAILGTHKSSLPVWLETWVGDLNLVQLNYLCNCTVNSIILVQGYGVAYFKIPEVFVRNLLIGLWAIDFLWKQPSYNSH